MSWGALHSGGKYEMSSHKRCEMEMFPSLLFTHQSVRQKLEVAGEALKTTGFINYFGTHLDPSKQTLVVGCGNSYFSAQLCAKNHLDEVT